jgi:GT2 family glycosyltransferase
VQASLSVVLVTFNERSLIERCLPPLLDQLSDGDELIVADNASSDGSADAVGCLAPRAQLLRMPENRGYMPACNLAAERARGDLLVMLDTDTVVAPGFCAAIRRPLARGWAAWMGLVTMDEGRLVNTSGGVVHFTGISWAGGIGGPAAATEPREVGFASGACLAVTRDEWRRNPGFPPHYFLYFDDVDYSLRVRLGGGRVGIEPSARVDHLYDFARREVKWRLLERNRWATIVRTYPTALLALVAPALVATELALLAVAARQGWLRQKLLAMVDLARWGPRLVRERRAIQGARKVSAKAFADGLVAELSSPYLGALGRSRTVRLVLRGYWAAVKWVLER